MLLHSLTIQSFITGLPPFLLSVFLIFAQGFVRQKKRTISELIRLCSERSPEWQKYWNEFEERFGKTILFYIYREFKMFLRYPYSLEYDEIVKDLRQDVYIKLLKNDAKALRRFRGNSEQSFLAFLHVIARNTVYNYVKSRKNRDHISFSKLEHMRENDRETLNTFEAATNDATVALEQKDLREYIMTNLRECYDSRNLERDLLIFQKYCLDGYTSEEVKSVFNLDLKPSAIETIVGRMKKQLKKSLKK